MRSNPLIRVVRKLGWMAALLAMQLAWTSTASATCGDHLLPHDQAMLGHTPAATGPQHQPSDTPRPQSPCRGLHCSKGTPLAPTPLPVRVQVEDQHCWFSPPEIAAWSSEFEPQTCADGVHFPERHAGRLDRPPRTV